MSGEAQPNIGSQSSSSPAPPQSSSVSSQPPRASGVARTTATARAPQVQIEAGTISLEVGESLFEQKFSWVKPPKDELVQAMCEVPDAYLIRLIQRMPSLSSSLQTC